MAFALCFILIGIGLYAVFVKKNVVKIVLGLMIVEYGVNLMLILTGYRKEGEAPIRDQAASLERFLSRAVDPMPQAMVVCSIVAGLGLLILMVALCIRLYERYGTFDITEMRRLKG